jgi:hypothetical protein
MFAPLSLKEDEAITKGFMVGKITIYYESISKCRTNTHLFGSISDRVSPI